MIKIEVKSAEVDTKSGTSQKSGKPYSIDEQTAYAHLYERNGQPAPFPVRIRLTLDQGQSPYPIGVYQLDPASIYPDRFGQLAIRAQLKPLHAAVKAAA